MKKIEIIERITDANGSISENILTSWEHKNQFIPEIIRFGELKIYLQERIVKKNDSDVHLSKYEYDILLLLAKSPGRIFGKEMVYDLVWNEPYSGDYNVVMRHICNIREKKGIIMAKKTALLGMLVALAFVLSYIETLIPVNLGIPGAKLGLANLVVMVALYTLGTKEAFALSMVRILLTGLTFSSMAAMLYSFAGGLLSFAVMYLAKRSKLFSAAGVSVLGGISHNAGQIFVAMWVLDTATLIYYLPVLAITGIASGTVIGLLAVMVIRRVSGMINRWD